MILDQNLTRNSFSPTRFWFDSYVTLKWPSNKDFSVFLHKNTVFLVHIDMILKKPLLPNENLASKTGVSFQIRSIGRLERLKDLITFHGIPKRSKNACLRWFFNLGLSRRFRKFGFQLDPTPTWPQVGPSKFEKKADFIPAAWCS